MAFHENWYSETQLAHLVSVCRYTRLLQGATVEIGCWEGRSTVALANACQPATLIAVDTWAGNRAEGDDHVTVGLLRERDVYADFVENIRTLTPGNVEVRRADCFDFLEQFAEPVRFCHIDASHDYASVQRTLKLLVPKVVDGGILCGDDYCTAGSARHDLDGGVERACLEVIPGHYSIGNFWFWRKHAY